MIITATSPTGATLRGVHVSISGPVTREGDTDDNGTLRLTAMRPGTYRARFSGDGVITFEREVVVAGTRAADVDVTLNPAEAKAAPPPPPAPPPPAPVAAQAPVGPPGQPHGTSVLDILTKDRVGKNARRDSLFACSGNTRTTIVQLNQDQSQRLYEHAETVLYAIGGEGTVRAGGRDIVVNGSQATAVSIPRNVPYSITKRSNQPLVLLSVLAGEPCEETQ